MLSINISLRHKVKYGFVVKKNKNKKKHAIWISVSSLNHWLEKYWLHHFKSRQCHTSFVNSQHILPVKTLISTAQPLVVQVFFLWAVFYWELRIGQFFLLTTNRSKHARQWEKMKWRKNKEASQSEAANIKKWFTVAANFSRWWVNVNGTWQSNFLQNTLWMQKGEEEKRLKRDKRIGELRRQHTERKGEQKEPYSSNMFLPAVTLVPIQV